MGAAEGAMGDSGGGGVEEAGRECPSAGPAAQETQATLPQAIPEPSE